MVVLYKPFLLPFMLNTFAVLQLKFSSILFNAFRMKNNRERNDKYAWQYILSNLAQYEYTMLLPLKTYLPFRYVLFYVHFIVKFMYHLAEMKIVYLDPVSPFSLHLICLISCKYFYILFLYFDLEQGDTNFVLHPILIFIP